MMSLDELGKPWEGLYKGKVTPGTVGWFRGPGRGLFAPP